MQSALRQTAIVKPGSIVEVRLPLLQLGRVTGWEVTSYANRYI